MERVVGKWIPTAIAVVTGVLTLAGYLFPSTLLGIWRDQLVEWAIIVGGFAVILGLLNVLNVHGKRVFSRKKGWVHSLALLLAALATWIPPIPQGPSRQASQQMFDYVIAPVGASLAALLVFTLTLAAFRLVRNRRSPWSLLFIGVVALTLLGSTPIQGFEWLSEARTWLVRVPGMAGMRGLLLGVALGIVVTGLRVLLTQDRPYSEF
jgi:hypothetical protein